MLELKEVLEQIAILRARALRAHYEAATMK